MSDIEYYRPRNLEDAVAFLGRTGAGTRILAGGTDLMIDRRAGVLNADCLCDVSRLVELKRIEIIDGRLEIGAGVTMNEIVHSEAIARFALALKIAASQFAGNQIRNVATIGGNVAHCSPCGDTVPPLFIHDARAVVRNKSGDRAVTLSEMAGGPYHCSLSPGDLITHFELKPMETGMTRVDFQKIGRRRALSIARLSMAVMARQEKDRSISFIRFALGACTPTPHHFNEIESALLGKVPTEKLLWEVGEKLAREMLVITGRRSSAVYKEPAIAGLFVRILYPLVASSGKPVAP